MRKLRRNRNIIIAAIASVVAIIIIITLLSGGKSSYNGYTASYGSTLHVKEKYKFDLTVTNPLSKTTITDSVLYDGDYAKIGIRVNNLDSSGLLLSVCTIDLVDENKQVIAQNSTFINQNDNIATKEISPKMSQEGALYFDTQYLTNTKTFDETVITRAKYLKLGVLASASVNDGRLTGDNEDYYIELR